jgi:tetratricopeptide (TPR) repeat protein
MASKEVMATAPVMALLFERTLISGSFRKALEQSWPLYAGLTATWLLLLALNFSAPRGDTAGFGLGIPAASWWLTQSKVLWMYLKLCVWPWPLVIHYHIPPLELRQAWPYALATALLTAGTLVLLWRRSAAGYALAVVFAILAPTFLVPITTEVAAERRMYLPLAALVTLAVVGIYRSLLKYPLRWLPAAAAGALAAAYSLVSIGRLEAYGDPAALWRHALVHQPGAPLAHNNLGRTLLDCGDREGAREHFQEAVRLDPRYDMGHFNLANVLSESGQSEEALVHYREALRLNPEYVEVYGNMAAAYLRMGQPAEALNAVQAGIHVARSSGQDAAARHLEAWVQANRARFDDSSP